MDRPVSFLHHYASAVKKIITAKGKTNIRWSRAHSLWLEEWMLKNEFFSLSQASLWSVLLSVVGLAETSDDEDDEDNENDDSKNDKADGKNEKDKFNEEVREFLVGKLKIKIATIRTQLIEKGRVRSTGMASIPFELLPSTEMIKDRLNAILAIANGHEEVVEGVINDWLKKRKEIENPTREIEDRGSQQ